MALLFLDHGTRRGEESASRPRKDPVPIVQEVGWTPRPFWTGAENLATTGIRSPTLQLLASRYTDYVTRPTTYDVMAFNK